MLKEVIKTSGDIRRTLAQTIIDIRCGDLSVDKGMCVAALAKEITASIQAEVNVAKVQASMHDAGKDMGRLQQLGRMAIEDSGTPMLSGIHE